MFNSFGEFLMALRAAALAPSARDPRLLEQRGAALGASEAVPADGGFLMQPEFSRALVERMYLTGAVLQRCMEFPISTKSNAIAFPQLDEQSRQDGSRFGGVRSFWANEADTATATKPKFRRSEITASKVIALVWLTDELFQDTEALSIFVDAAASKELAFRLEDAIINGDGAGKPQGVMKSGALITVAKQSGQGSGTVIAQNILDCWSRMWAPSRRTAVWCMHTDAESQIIGATVAAGTGGGPIQLWKAAEDDEGFNRVLGRPVLPLEQLQIPGTPGDVIFCDFARYALAMREARTDVSIHVQFLADEVAFRVVMRVGGQTIDATPITPFTGPNQVSPFVCIAQR